MPRARTPKIGCSADQVYSQGRQCADNWRPSCSCAAKFAGRTASNTATGALSRTRASAAARGAAARAVSGRDQRHARIGVAEVDRGLGRQCRNPAVSLFPEDRCAGPLADASIVGVKLSAIAAVPAAALGRVLAGAMLWRELQLDLFLSKRLGVSRKGTGWDQVLRVLIALPPAGAGQRMAATPRVVSAQRLGRSAGRGCRTRRTTSCIAVTTDCWCTNRRSSITCGALARSVQHQL